MGHPLIFKSPLHWWSSQSPSLRIISRHNILRWHKPFPAPTLGPQQPPSHLHKQRSRPFHFPRRRLPRYFPPRRGARDTRSRSKSRFIRASASKRLRSHSIRSRGRICHRRRRLVVIMGSWWGDMSTSHRCRTRRTRTRTIIIWFTVRFIISGSGGLVSHSAKETNNNHNGGGGPRGMGAYPVTATGVWRWGTVLSSSSASLLLWREEGGWGKDEWWVNEGGGNWGL